MERVYVFYVVLLGIGSCGISTFIGFLILVPHKCHACSVLLNSPVKATGLYNVKSFLSKVYPLFPSILLSHLPIVIPCPQRISHLSLGIKSTTAKNLLVYLNLLLSRRRMSTLNLSQRSEAECDRERHPKSWSDLMCTHSFMYLHILC